jgi:hypothetical protein
MKFLGMNIGSAGGKSKPGKNREKAKELMEFRAEIEPIIDPAFVEEVQGVREQVRGMKMLTKTFARAYAAIRTDQAEIAAVLAALFKEVKRADLVEHRAANSVLRDEQQFAHKTLEESVRHNHAMNRLGESHKVAMEKIEQSHQEAVARLGNPQQPQVTRQQQKQPTKSLFGGWIQW